MARQYSLEWLAQEGFSFTGPILCFMPPNYLTYRHEDGRRASMEDTLEGYLLVDGKPLHSNREAVELFSSILRRADYHL